MTDDNIVEAMREAYDKASVGCAEDWEDRAMRAALSVARPMIGAQRWLPIESAPKDGTRVLAWNAKWNAAVTVQYYGDWWSIAYHLGELRYQPTHWMPLPTPPATGEKDNG